MERSQIEQISKALADETRLEIFAAIAAKGPQGKMSCGEIVACQGVTGATVSHHLKVLLDAGLIACRKDGQFVHSQAVPQTMQAYTRALASLVKGKKSAGRRNRPAAPNA